MREREKKTRKAIEKPRSYIVRDDEKLARDWSAEERFVNRSMRIRRDVKKWLRKQEREGREFETSGMMSDMCGNDCRCSSTAAYRWLHQWSAPNGKFRIEERENGYLHVVKRTEKVFVHTKGSDGCECETCKHFLLEDCLTLKCPCCVNEQ